MQDLMPPVNTPDKLFHNGDPTQGIEGTIVTAEWLNDSQSATRDAQQEVINVLAGANILPDGSKQNQLLTAIQALISTAVNGAKYVPDVGELYITKSQTNPNTKWPGTTWVYLGEGLTLRTAKADFSDLGMLVGADTVTLSVANMPGHTHTFSATTGAYDFAPAATSSQAAQNLTSGAYDFAPIGTSSFDYGSRSTDNHGGHSHSIDVYYLNTSQQGARVGAGGTYAAVAGTQATQSGGAHAHTVTIGAHSHTVDLPPHTHTVSVPAHSHTLDLPPHTHSVSGTSGSAGNGSSFSIIQRSVLVAVWERTS